MKKSISLVLAVVIALSVATVTLFSVSAADKEPVPTGAKSGTTGDCTWELVGGVLTISGNGRMGDYNRGGSIGIDLAPWYNMVTEVVIKDGVTVIGQYAFLNCKKLTKVTLSESVYGIAVSAFEGCTSLSEITIPSSVILIGDYAFSGCTSLTSATLPDSVTNLGKYAFSDCKSLTSVTIPDSVSNIEQYTFYKCTSLSSVTIPNSVTNIGDHAFYGCRNLTSVIIPYSVKQIVGQSFGYYSDIGFSEIKVRDFTIFGYKDTASEQYAKKNDFKFVLVGAPVIPIFGDIDGDGKVDIYDASLIQKYIAGNGSAQNYGIGKPIG